jgi:8-oxo-dGTP diphosphatase
MSPDEVFANAGPAAPASGGAAHRPTLRASAVIFVDNRLLLVRQRRREEDYWLLPGGGLRFGESLAAALVREAWEELVVETVVRRPIALVESISPEPDKYAKHVVHVIFDAALAPGQHIAPGTDPAVLEYRLVSRADLPALRMAPPLNDFLDTCFDALPERLVYLGQRW